MNVIFLDPGFPANQREFVRAVQGKVSVDRLETVIEAHVLPAARVQLRHAAWHPR